MMTHCDPLLPGRVNIKSGRFDKFFCPIRIFRSVQKRPIKIVQVVAHADGMAFLNGLWAFVVR